MKLKPEHIHMLRLAKTGADSEGWAKVSPQVFPHLANLPSELLTVEGSAQAGGRCKLTEAGETILKFS